MVQGDDFYATVWVSNPDTGALVDLTGWTVRSQVRKTTDSAAILASFETAIVGVGQVYLHLAGSVTATISGSAVWDFELTNPTGSGQVMTPCGGIVTMIAEVTR
jgi:hypothetical protein